MTSPRLPKSKTYGSVGANANGKMLDKAPPRIRWEVGTVWDNSPGGATYTVNTGTGPLHNVRRLVHDPGENSILSRGTEVVVHYELGFAVIHAVLKSAATHALEANPAQLTEVRGVGGEDGVYAQSTGTGNSRAPNDPIDIISDDWVRKGKHNNFVGVMAGGTNILHSSPMAQIRTHSVNDMVEVMADVYRHISSLGNLEIVNDGGKTSLIWRAGADQFTENGANAENWTLRLDAGATGDLFRLAVTTPHNNTLCEVHMSADGRLSLTGVAGIDMASGPRGTAVETVAENKQVDVFGEMNTTVKNSMSQIIGAQATTLVGTSSTLSTGSDLNETVGRNRSAHVSGQMKTVVEGGGTTPPPTAGNLAILWEAVNGGIETVTGNPAHLASPSAQQAQNFVNYAGSINFAIQPTAAGGKFAVLSAMPDSVLLGADGAAVDSPTGHTITATAAKHAMMYEPFNDMMGTLLQWLDNHTHLSAMGPTGTAAAGTGGPVSPSVQAKLPLIKSLRICIGA